MRKIIYVFLLITVASCASVSNYPIDLSYQPKSHVEGVKKGTVTIALFNDKRAVSDKRFIGIEENDKIRFISLVGEPSSAVSNAFATYLESSGYTAAMSNEMWDGSVQLLKPEWGDMVVGGGIENFDITVTGGFPKIKYICSVKLYVTMADPKTKAILHQERVEASSSYETLNFSRDKAEEEINKALAEVVEKSLGEINKYFPTK